MYNGTQYWLAKDITRELGYSDAKNMIRNTEPFNVIELSSRDVGSLSEPTSFESLGISKKTPKAAFITEHGIYDCLDHSRISPKAEEFRAWFNTTVRLSVRKTGAYLDNDVTEKLIQNPDYVYSIIAQNNELQIRTRSSLFRSVRMAYFEENDAFYPVITSFGIEYFVNYFIKKFTAQDV